MSVTGPCERSACEEECEKRDDTRHLGTTVRLGLCTCTSQFTSSSSYNVLRVEDARKLRTIDGRDEPVRRA